MGAYLLRQRAAFLGVQPPLEELLSTAEALSRLRALALELGLDSPLGHELLSSQAAQGVV